MEANQWKDVTDPEEEMVSSVEVEKMSKHFLT